MSNSQFYSFNNSKIYFFKNYKKYFCFVEYSKTGKNDAKGKYVQTIFQVFDAKNSITFP